MAVMQEEGEEGEEAKEEEEEDAKHCSVLLKSASAKQRPSVMTATLVSSTCSDCTVSRNQQEQRAQGCTDTCRQCSFLLGSCTKVIASTVNMPTQPLPLLADWQHDI